MARRQTRAVRRQDAAAFTNLFSSVYPAKMLHVIHVCLRTVRSGYKVHGFVYQKLTATSYEAVVGRHHYNIGGPFLSVSMSNYKGAVTFLATDGTF